MSRPITSGQRFLAAAVASVAALAAQASATDFSVEEKHSYAIAGITMSVIALVGVAISVTLLVISRRHEKKHYKKITTYDNDAENAADSKTLAMISNGFHLPARAALNI